MASQCVDVLHILQSCCHTLDELDVYVQSHGLDINHAAVVQRRSELLCSQLITDADTHRLLSCCCTTVDELRNLVEQYGLDWNDPAVRARQQDLEVCRAHDELVLRL